MQSSDVKPTKTYIIRNKQTLEIWVAASGKRSWKQPAHAKNAFSNDLKHQKKDPLIAPLLEKYKKSYKWGDGLKYYYDTVKFDQQDIYEIVEVKPDTDKKVMAAAELLKRVLAEDNYRMDLNLQLEIEKFLKDL